MSSEGWMDGWKEGRGRRRNPHNFEWNSPKMRLFIQPNVYSLSNPSNKWATAEALDLILEVDQVVST